MPLSLEEKVRLLSRVDVFESLVREELEEVARQACDTPLERAEVMRKPQEEGTTSSTCSKRGASSFTWRSRMAERSRSRWWRGGAPSGS